MLFIQKLAHLIMSFPIHMIKTNATLEEVEKVLKWMKNIYKKS